MAVAGAPSGGPAAAGAPPAAASVPSGAAQPAVTPQVLLDGVGPLVWNAAVDRERGLGGLVPHWPAVRVLSPLGAESLYVFPSRAPKPALLASWPREDRGDHAVRIFPRYRWIVIESPDSAAADSTAVAPSAGLTEDAGDHRRVRFFAANGALLFEARSSETATPLGRNLVLLPRPPAGDDAAPHVSVRRLPEGDDRASWLAVAGWGTSSPLENFLAANTVGLVDPATGLRQDELRLLDLDGKILWTRAVAADQREFTVSNFGDVAIAREKLLRVFDRSGAEKLHVPLPRNVVGRTAISSDGRFVLAAARPPVGRRAEGDLWVGLYETTKKTPVWSRRNLGGRLSSDVLELSISDDGQRALLRLSTGPVLLLGRDGALLARWNLERISRGEYDPGVTPRRSWLSGDGTLVALTTPVARTLADARGWLYKVPRSP